MNVFLAFKGAQLFLFLFIDEEFSEKMSEENITIIYIYNALGRDRQAPGINCFHKQ